MKDEYDISKLDPRRNPYTNSLKDEIIAKVAGGDSASGGGAVPKPGDDSKKLPARKCPGCGGSDFSLVFGTDMPKIRCNACGKTFDY